MPLDPQAAAAIAVGKCYITAGGQVRRVLEIAGSRVNYEARGKKAQKAPWPSRETAEITTFAEDVEREVRCDYDPNFNED